MCIVPSTTAPSQSMKFTVNDTSHTNGTLVSDSVDCKWSAFSDWTTCSVSCGGGTQKRSRRVIVEETEGGQRCSGQREETKNCNTGVCPTDCKWSQFGFWSQCSASCGEGTQKRSRSVLVEATGGGRGCSGRREETKYCNNRPCPTELNQSKIAFRLQSNQI